MGGRSLQVGAMLELCWSYVGLCWTILAPKLPLEAAFWQLGSDVMATWPLETGTWPLQEALGSKNWPKVAYQRGRVRTRNPWDGEVGAWGRGKGEGDFHQRQQQQALDTWPEAGGYTCTYTYI